MTVFYLIYLAVINVVTFVYYGIDKYKARRSKWRIPESTLLILAGLGGALGALVAMKLFRHKTLHLKFMILVPLFAVAWVYLTVNIMRQ